MNPHAVAVLASGGFDSNVLLAELLKTHASVHPLYMRCGFLWEKAELHWLRKYLKGIRNRKLRPLTVLNLPVADFDRGWAMTGRGTPGYRSPDEDVFLPGRNLLLLSKAAAYCASRGIARIALGTLASNPFPDATPSFFRCFEKAAATGLGRPVRVLTPFARFKKKQVFERAKKIKNLPFHLSFSCLAPRGIHACRRCNKCAEKDGLFDG